MKARIAGYTMVSLAAVWTAVACQTNKPKEQPRDRQGGAEDPDDDGASLVTYNGKIKAVLDTYCTSCHSGSQAPNLKGYANAKKWAEDSLRAIEDKSMPPGSTKVKVSETRLFADWIDAGMPESTSRSTGTGTGSGTGTGTGTGSGVSLVTYENWTRSYVQTACLTCHSSNGRSPDLSSYTKLKSYGTAVLRSMENGSMPQGNSATSAQIDKMRQWVNSGMVEYDPSGGGTSTGTGTGTGSSLTYQNGMRQWLQDYCLSCHYQNGASPDLSTEARAKSAANAMLNSVQAGRMPQGRQLSTSEKAKLEEWVRAGTP